MGKTLRDLLRAYERDIVVRTMHANKGDYDLTAGALGITRRALDKILLRHHLARRRYTKALPITKQHIVRFLSKDNKENG